MAYRSGAIPFPPGLSRANLHIPVRAAYAPKPAAVSTNLVIRPATNLTSQRSLPVAFDENVAKKKSRTEYNGTIFSTPGLNLSSDIHSSAPLHYIATKEFKQSFEGTFDEVPTTAEPVIDDEKYYANDDGEYDSDDEASSEDYVSVCESISSDTLYPDDSISVCERTFSEDTSSASDAEDDDTSYSSDTEDSAAEAAFAAFAWPLADFDCTMMKQKPGFFDNISTDYARLLASLRAPGCL